MRNVKATLLFVALISLAFSCGKKSKSKDSDDEEEPTGNALLLSEATAAESFSLATAAVESIDTAIAEAAGSLAIEEDVALNLVEEEEAPNLSKWCTGHGEPLAVADTSFSSLRLEGSERLNSSDAKYAARLFHCKMKVDSGDPETIRGVIGMPKGLICALEQEGLLDFENPGKVSGNITLDTDCFSENFINSMKRQGYDLDTTIDAETSLLTDVEGGWQKKISMTNFALDPDAEIEIHLFNSTEQVALKITQTDTSNKGSQTVSSFALTQDGVLRIETKTYRMASSRTDNQFSLAFRVLAQGDLVIEEKDGVLTPVYTSFAHYDGIFSSLSKSGETISGQMATIIGTVDDGFLTKTYTCSQGGTPVCAPAGSIDTFTIGEDKCVPSKKKCSGLKAIKFDSTDFLMGETVLETAEFTAHGWGADLVKPLDFTALTTDFSQYPE